MATKKTSIYLDEELDRALAARAAEEGVTKAEFIRRNLEVVVARPQRPRLSVGQLRRRPDYVQPEDQEHEIAELVDRRERQSHGSSA